MTIDTLRSEDTQILACLGLKGIVKYPPKGSKQLPAREVLQLRFPLKNSGVAPEFFKGKSGVAPDKTLQHVDDYSYSHLN